MNKSIPEFKNEDEEHAFWAKNDSLGLGAGSLDGCLGFFGERGMDDPDRMHENFHDALIHSYYSID